MLIGLVVSGLVEDYIKNIIKGVERMANQENVDFVIFPGKYVDYDYASDYDLTYAYQYNTMYSYSLLPQFDGLIIEMASICMYSDEAKKQLFAGKYSHIPRVFIGYDEPGTPGVFINNESGLISGMEAMYKSGARKFGMVGGSEDNVDSIQRKKVFVDFLKSKGIEYNDKMYVTGDFFWPCENEIRKLLRNNKGIDAIVCANDIIAGRVYDVLQEYNLAPGKDVSVLGYDDSANASVMTPALSSVRADFVELGVEAFRSLMRVLRGDTVKDIYINTKFINRSSIKTIEEEADDSKAVDFFEIVQADVHILDERVILNLRMLFYQISSHIMSVRRNDKDVEYYKDAVNKKLNEMFELRAEKYLDLGRMLVLIEKMIDKQKKIDDDQRAHRILDEILLIAHKNVLSNVNELLVNKTHENVMEIIGIQEFIRGSMQFVRENDQAYSQVLDRIKWIGIQNAEIVIFDKPIIHLYKENFVIPKEINLKAVIKHGKLISIPKNEQRIAYSQIFKNQYLDWKDYHTMIAEPIFYNEFVYGIMLIDLKRAYYQYYELLVNQIGASIKMLTLLGDNEKIMADYERTLQNLKENNIVLDNMSKSDSLTGLLNRRGFEKNANILIDDCFGTQKEVCIIYIDMNNLKIINDRFGHNEGDESIINCGNILLDVFGHRAVVSRIGGDEFAVACLINRGQTTEDKIKEIYDAFDVYNEKSDKEYLISVAAGAHVIKQTDDVTLNEALMQADENLYKEKSKRSKIILKS